ncbi:MAG: hypothetical protein IPL78_16655 [Chloroflexi bacterium]|nr:hypothetical protein [Chloroflexota bacterium]
MLCSDGLSDMIDDEVIRESLTTYQTQLQSGVHDLINKANQAGGRDNITALVLQIPGKVKAAGLMTGRLPRMTTASMPAIASPVATTAVSQPLPPAQPIVERRRSGLPFILVGIVLLVLVTIVVVAAIIGAGLLRETTDTPSPTSTQTTLLTTAEPGFSEQQTTLSAATLAVIEIMTQGNESVATLATTTQLVEPTPGLIPTNTNTPTRRPPTATYTPPPTATPSETPSPIPGGGGSSPTNTPRPANTSAPTNPPPPPPTIGSSRATPTP